MKKILILIAALAITIGAKAQEKPFTYGLKAGMNLSHTTSGTTKILGETQSYNASGTAIGFFASGHFNYSFGEFVGIQPELSFSMQGAKESEGNFSSSLTFNYINIPVLFEVKPMENLSIFVGPQVGFNIYRSMTNKKGDESETLSGSDFDDRLKANDSKLNSFDFAAAVGLQYAIVGKYLISARYNIGFNTVIGSNADELSVSGGATRVFQFGFGYQF